MITETMATHVNGDVTLSGMLISASAKGDVKMLQELLTTGADVNITDSSGTTALMAAAKGGHENVWVF